MNRLLILVFCMVNSVTCGMSVLEDFNGAGKIDTHGYTGCIELFNKTCRVVLEPNFGGRVLEYSLNGKNVLYIDPKQDGYVYTAGDKWVEPCAGRFDIGAEKNLPKRMTLWAGRWTASITGDRSAQMSSGIDPAVQVRLVRKFSLADEGTHLECTQTIINEGKEEKRLFHWGRTFAVGGGICMVPLNPRSRYPKGYILYGPHPHTIDFQPDDQPNIRRRDGVLEILGPTDRPKFAIDSEAGWIGYITKENLLFVKTFAVYPDRPYGEIAANAVSIWYMEERVCEIEPIGPTEFLRPGGHASFTEHWNLYEFEYPDDKKPDLDKVKTLALAENKK